MPSGGKIDATRISSGNARRTGQSIRVLVEHSEHPAAWIFSRRGTHGSYAVDACARTRFVNFPKTNRGRWKKQSHDNKRRTSTALPEIGVT